MRWSQSSVSVQKSQGHPLGVEDGAGLALAYGRACAGPFETELLHWL